MNLRNAASLALVGTLLLTIVLAVDFVNALVAVLRDLIPMIALLRSMVYVFASICVTLFFFAFTRDPASMT